jgi:hypothetical protein
MVSVALGQEEVDHEGAVFAGVILHLCCVHLDEGVHFLTTRAMLCI